MGEGIWKQIILEKRRIKLTESLTPEQSFGVGGGLVADTLDEMSKTTGLPLPEGCTGL